MKVLTKRFLVSDLFNVNTGSLVSKKRLSELADKNGVPRISVTTDDNGQIGHYTDNKEISNVRYFRNFITVNFFGKVYYHPSKASVEMKVHVLTLKSGKELTREVGMYLVTVLRKTFDNGSYNYGNQLSSSKIKKGQYNVELPVTPAGDPDFEYMTARIRELEAERIRELEAYLRVTGLDDTTLSVSETQALTQKVQWKKFRIGDVFEIHPSARKINANAVKFNGHYPYVARGTSTNGIRGYINWDTNDLNPANTISFGQDTATIYYQDKPYFTGDKIQIFELKDRFPKLNSETAQFMIACMNAVFGNYTWGQQSFAVKKLREAEFMLPVTFDNDIDFDYMQNYIRATEKRTIKGVVEYKDKVIEETKKVVND